MAIMVARTRLYVFLHVHFLPCMSHLLQYYTVFLQDLFQAVKPFWRSNPTKGPSDVILLGGGGRFHTGTNTDIYTEGEF